MMRQLAAAWVIVGVFGTVGCSDDDTAPSELDAGLDGGDAAVDASLDGDGGTSGGETTTGRQTTSRGSTGSSTTIEVDASVQDGGEDPTSTDDAAVSTTTTDSTQSSSSSTRSSSSSTGGQSTSSGAPSSTSDVEEPDASVTDPIDGGGDGGPDEGGILPEPDASSSSVTNTTGVGQTSTGPTSSSTSASSTGAATSTTSTTSTGGPSSSTGGGTSTTSETQVSSGTSDTTDETSTSDTSVEIDGGVEDAGDASDDGDGSVDYDASNDDAALDSSVPEVELDAGDAGDGALDSGIDVTDTDEDAGTDSGDGAVSSDVTTSTGTSTEEPDLDASSPDADDASDESTDTNAPTSSVELGDGGEDAGDAGDTEDAGDAGDAGDAEEGSDASVDASLDAGDALDAADGSAEDGGDAEADGGDAEADGGEFSDVAGLRVSGDTLECEANELDQGRKAAVDVAGRLYVLMNCNGDLYVASSSDRGLTWSPPVNTGLDDAASSAIEGGLDGVAYVTAVNDRAELTFVSTQDGGTNWEAPRTLLTGLGGLHVSLDAFDDSVYIAVVKDVTVDNETLTVLRNSAAGEGEFLSQDVAVKTFIHDVAVDKTTGQVMVMGDNPVLEVRLSSDFGATFGTSWTLPDHTLLWADWAAANGNIYVTGIESRMYVLSASDLVPVPRLIEGLPIVPMEEPAQPRSIDADNNGNAYIATAMYPGVRLDRWVSTQEEVKDADSVNLSDMGGQVSVAALPTNNGALVVYTVFDEVFAAVEVY